MDNETLLPIHRKLTDKEKYDWAMKSFRELEVKFRAVSAQNEKLIVKNKKLTETVRIHEEEIPSTLNGASTITVKTFLKLKKRYQLMCDNFWRVNDELMQLKKKLQEERI